MASSSGNQKNTGGSGGGGRKGKGGGGNFGGASSLMMLFGALRNKAAAKGKPAITSTSGRGKIFRFKVTLKYTKPPIWRRIEVPGDYSFHQLHKVIQKSMGWHSGEYNYHLHQFKLSNCVGHIGVKPQIGEGEFDDDTLDGSKYFIYQYFCMDATVGTRRATYEYDFGDSWEHALLLETVKDPEPGKAYPICVTGKRACPPEDVGGIPGFYEFLELLKNPTDPEYEERRDWAASQGFDVDSDPAIFDPNKVKFPNMGGGAGDADTDSD